ncbi:MAG: DUF2141 domain-containing protein [Alphaproteobacteria bacterium GM7ARS4]|nr:DUF2141 domain-containing protein [Alphaproteobacteria bacterium GM7ARS4]
MMVIEQGGRRRTMMRASNNVMVGGTMVLAGLLWATCGWAGQIRLVVEDLRSQKGAVSLALYNNADEFPEGETLREHRVAVKDIPKGGIVFKNLVNGWYAIALYHDENGNDEFDTSFIGLPLENFGFSRNVKPFLSAPPFAHASFEVKPGVRSVAVVRMQTFSFGD